MQTITRRPQKQNKQRKAKAARNRWQRKQEREHERKLARKLNRMANVIDKGGYNGIKNSPLLHANWDYVMKRSLLAKRSWKLVPRKA